MEKLFVQEKNLLRFVHTFLFLFFGGWLSYNVSQNHLLRHSYMIRLWCIFYSKNKTLLTWSSWSRLYSSLNFPEKTKLCYISFYTGKIPWTFLPSLVYLASQPSLLITCNAQIGNFSFILFLIFSIAEEKTKITAKTVSNQFMQL